MASRKTAVAALALMAPGTSAIGPYYTSATTVSAEPRLVGSSTSNGLVLYSFNYCTVVQSTTCQVTVSTSDAATPEYTSLSVIAGDTTIVVTVPVSSSASSSSSASPAWGGESATSTAAGVDASVSSYSSTSTSTSSPAWGGESATSTAAGVDASVSQTITIDLGQPSETAPITNTQPSSTAVITAVISTTDEAGNPTLLTSTSTAGLGWTTSSSDTTSEATSSSTSEASTTRAGYNSTMTSHQPSGATTGSTSAPKKSGSGALHAISAFALGASIIAALIVV